jgi:hypothetical protein
MKKKRMSRLFLGTVFLLALCTLHIVDANGAPAAGAAEFKVPATGNFNNPLGTGIQLAKGQEVVLEPNKTDRWVTKPNGTPYDYRGAPKGELTLKWKIGEKSGVVVDGKAFAAPVEGELCLYCMDKVARDNLGFIRVTVRVGKDPAADVPKPAVGTPRTSAPRTLIDVVVPSTRPAAGANAPTSAPVGDPNAIDRPEFQTKPRRLVRSVSSVTSMMVVVGADGMASGFTSDIIATVPPESRNSEKAGVGFFRVDGDETMRVAFEEAVRAVTLRYPRWEPGHIDISFGEKFNAHGGPSAGSAFALLMLSCLEGFEIDSRCAITGDISVDWKVRKVGGVTAKLRGATLDKCRYAAIPEGNATAFADMALLYGNNALWDIQVFSIATLQEAIAIARTDRSANLARAIQLFAELQPQLTKGQLLTLKSPQMRDALKRILALAPNHLSAKYLLAIGEGTAPTTLSANATIYQLSSLFYPYRVLLASGKKLDRNSLPQHVTALARKRLATLRPIGHKDLQPVIKELSAFIEALDGAAGNMVSPTALIARARQMEAQFSALDSDPGFVERLVREGY